MLRGRGRARPPVPLGAALLALALVGGFVSAELRARRVATPMLDRIRIAKLTGTIEEVDLRPAGARVLLAVAGADGIEAGPAAPRAPDGERQATTATARSRPATPWP